MVSDKLWNSHLVSLGSSLALDMRLPKSEKNEKA